MNLRFNIINQFQHLLNNLQPEKPSQNPPTTNPKLTGPFWLITALFISSILCLVSASIFAATPSFDPMCFASKSRNCFSRSLRYFSISSWASSLACFSLRALPRKIKISWLSNTTPTAIYLWERKKLTFAGFWDLLSGSFLRSKELLDPLSLTCHSWGKIRHKIRLQAHLIRGKCHMIGSWGDYHWAKWGATGNCVTGHVTCNVNIVHFIKVIRF